MKIKWFFVFFGLILVSTIIPSDFLEEQKKYERVRTAISEKEKSISESVMKRNLKLNEINILLIAYKEDKILELYVKKKSETTYQLHQSYDICAQSGKLGPKRKQGDNQVPEGFYYIDRFNPTSVFYLSLGINYPNQSDRIKSKYSNLGGDIFIHGSCVTIGCLPMTDDKIKEIYLYAIHAKNNGQMKIPVYIFPFRLTKDNISKYKPEIDYNESIIQLWRNLKTGYELFEKDKKELKYSIGKNGDYVF